MKWFGIDKYNAPVICVSEEQEKIDKAYLEDINATVDILFPKDENGGRMPDVEVVRRGIVPKSTEGLFGANLKPSGKDLGFTMEEMTDEEIAETAQGRNLQMGDVARFGENVADDVRATRENDEYFASLKSHTNMESEPTPPAE